MTIRIENAAADPRALRDEDLKTVTGGESKPKGGGVFSVTMYTESVKLNLQQVDA
jgi:hypothetical protein